MQSVPTAIWSLKAVVQSVSSAVQHQNTHMQEGMPDISDTNTHVQSGFPTVRHINTHVQSVPKSVRKANTHVQSVAQSLRDMNTHVQSAVQSVRDQNTHDRAGIPSVRDITAHERCCSPGVRVWKKSERCVAGTSWLALPPLWCLVRFALNNRRMKEQGVPELRLPCRDSGIMEAKPDRRADEGGKDLDPAALRRPARTERKEQASHLTSLTGTARWGTACRVVWEGWQAQSCHLDPIRAL